MREWPVLERGLGHAPFGGLKLGCFVLGLIINPFLTFVNRKFQKNRKNRKIFIFHCISGVFCSLDAAFFAFVPQNRPAFGRKRRPAIGTKGPASVRRGRRTLFHPGFIIRGFPGTGVFRFSGDGSFVPRRYPGSSPADPFFPRRAQSTLSLASSWARSFS